MSKTVKILDLRNETEASLMESLLTEADIPHMVKSYHDSAYDGLFQMQQGWGHVEAPEEYREKVLELYRTLPGHP
jgi:hypothetical protein